MLITNLLLPLPFPMPKLRDFDNPTSVSFSAEKEFLSKRTLGGHVYSHWGEKPEQMAVKGSIVLLPGQESFGFLSLLILKQLYRLDKTKVRNILGVASKVLSSGLIVATQYGELEERKKTLQQANLDSSEVELATNMEIALKALSLAAYTTRILKSSLNDLSRTFIYHDNIIYEGFFNKFNYQRDIKNYRLIDYDFTFTIEWSSDNALADFLLKTSKDKTVSGIDVGTNITGALG